MNQLYDFEFDCPSQKCDLHQLHFCDKDGSISFDEWFSLPHEAVSGKDTDNSVELLLLQTDSANLNLCDENSHNYIQRQRNSGEFDSNNSAKKRKKLSNGGSSSNDGATLNTAIGGESALLSAPARRITTSSTGGSANKTFKPVPGVSSLARPSTAPRPNSISHNKAIMEGKQPQDKAVPSIKKSLSVANSRGKSIESKVSTTKVASNSIQSAKRPATQQASAIPTTSSLEQLLKEHNARFAPVPAYEPPRHSVRDVRKWEKISGQKWSELKPEQREKANEEISRLKAENLLT